MFPKALGISLTTAGISENLSSKLYIELRITYHIQGVSIDQGVEDSNIWNTMVKLIWNTLHYQRKSH
jgi:hypothetical protein